MKRVRYYPSQTLGCIGCGKCCGGWPVPVSEEEVRSISALPLTGLPVSPAQCFQQEKRGWYLKKLDGHCIFLDDEKKCRIHSQFGFDAKPLTCRLYPLDVRTWSDGSVSAALRYDCPAAACGQGCELAACGPRILSFARELEKRRKKPATADYSEVIAPEVERLQEIADAYCRILTEESVPEKVRFYGAACLIHFHAKEQNSDDILEAEEFGDDAFEFFLRSVEHLSGCLEDPPKMRRDIPVAFRTLFWNFLRADESVPLAGRIASTVASLRFILGGGSLLRTPVKADVSAKMLFAAMRKCRPERGAFQPYLQFLRGRLESLHFCGTRACGLTFEEGLLYLLASYPVINALSAVFALSRGSFRQNREDVARAVILLDHSFLRTRLYTLRSMRTALRKVVSEEYFAALLSLCPDSE